MIKFLKTPAGMITGAAIVLIFAFLITYNWSTIKGWFSGSMATQRARKCRTTCPDGLVVGYDCNTDGDPCENHQK